ncbi:NfeD family protein [Pseudonocardia sp. N23]|uniref:NfeD family protein n=1 Tax=Pseudonocardia sp. N23 TaxID=1987376 RepID=UPI000BFE8C1F|nr:NfeD family protein [Pseudonocardia sp. N23]GAY10672.1 putative activity regulator of membrane protease YbbK [Pseudonocardia sp. N23]
MGALIWLIAGVALIAAEVLSGEFFLLMLGAGALAAAGGSLLGLSVLPATLVFAAVSVLLIFAVRPALRRRLDRGIEHHATNTEALVGRHGTVVAEIRGDHTGGRVKIGGDVWSAQAYDHEQTIGNGSRVRIIEISGATAMVLAED